jgi:hypothetical protein
MRIIGAKGKSRRKNVVQPMARAETDSHPIRSRPTFFMPGDDHARSRGHYGKIVAT